MDPAWLLWPIAALMAFVIAWLVRYSTHSRTVLGAAFVVFLLAMMAAMFLGALVAVSWPGPGADVLGLWAGALAMSASVFPIAAIALREARIQMEAGPSYVPRHLPSPIVLALWVTALVLVGELWMGRTFDVASGAVTAPAVRSLSDVLTWFGTTVTSSWFLFPMALEMSLATLWVRPRLSRPMVGILLAQSAVMFASPPAIAGTAWLVGSSIASSTVMAALVGYLLLLVYRGARLPRPVASYSARVLAAFAFMAAAVFVWAITGSALVFALAVIVQSAVFFTAIVVPEAYGTSTTSEESDRPTTTTPSGASS
ncbi:MAG: hypothetical protein L3K00_05715 [Thermoplasmata archaeon]|nr:hypothetical protein [Thermoplasmata archaeon]